MLYHNCFDIVNLCTLLGDDIFYDKTEPVICIADERAPKLTYHNFVDGTVAAMTASISVVCFLYSAKMYFVDLMGSSVE